MANAKSKTRKVNQAGLIKGEEGRNMKTLAIISLLCLGMFLVMGIGMAYADEDTGDTQTSTVSLGIPEVCKLTITPGNPTKTLGHDDGTVDGTAEAAFETGYVVMDAGAPTLHVRANKKWKLTAISNGFGAVGAYTKDVEDLLISDASIAGTVKLTGFTALSKTTQLEIASSLVGTGGGGPGNPASPEQHPCQYKILLNWQDDIPGTYTTIVTFTLATQGA